MEREQSSTNSTETSEYLYVKGGIWITPYTKFTLDYMAICNNKTIELREECIGVKLYGIMSGKVFFDTTPKAHPT